MRSIISILLVSMVICILPSCAAKKKMSNASSQLLEKAYQAHGGDKYERAIYSFTFRNKEYSFRNDGNNYQYTVEYDKKGKTIEDVMTNNTFARSINGVPTTLSEKQISGGRNGLNSVIYFATLPHKLNDPSVHHKHGGKTMIDGQPYELLEVTFAEEGGGKDHDDEYIYWINSSTNRIDYLAYNYSVGKGGVRFRSARNSRVVNGILFQDYINYKAPVGTPLKDLPGLFEKNKLTKLSEILTEEVSSLRN